MSFQMLTDTWWDEEPLPSRLHRCKPISRALDDAFLVERCACGAIRINKSVWVGKNSRRRERKS